MICTTNSFCFTWKASIFLWSELRRTSQPATILKSFCIMYAKQEDIAKVCLKFVMKRIKRIVFLVLYQIKYLVVENLSDRKNSCLFLDRIWVLNELFSGLKIYVNKFKKFTHKRKPPSNMNRSPDQGSSIHPRINSFLQALRCSNNMLTC